jgi:oligopeptide/dipeptide ABC transporter ATP-binding protein
VTAVLAPLLDVRSLTIEYPQGRRRPPLRALDRVDLAVAPAETVGLVGESGSGKTTLGKAVLGLCNVHSGKVVFAGRDVTHRNDFQRRMLSWDLQAVFQDPYSSLNPARTIGQTLGATLSVHQTLERKQLNERIEAALARVGLPPETAKRYPIHFSGGQRQRIAIARALIVRPRLIVCDEPVSALDLSVQAQTLNLLADLRDEFQLSYLFIAHDLDVVRHLSHRIVVLYHGRVMEQGPAIQVYQHPRHPYTQALIDAAPVPNPKLQRQKRNARNHTTTTPIANRTAGCPFAPRCIHATTICFDTQPPLERTPANTLVACHHWQHT